ncbi:hypothetical protein [Paraburkholderia sp.]|uniref:hypothetical protein n=1 Tax=Paraburkholderia sp. TaxID=1926495 RepID=UPI002AFE0802|nr:hypothetical protein [Paraburkholderia sp.]
MKTGGQAFDLYVIAFSGRSFTPDTCTESPFKTIERRSHFFITNIYDPSFRARKIAFVVFPTIVSFKASRKSGEFDCSRVSCAGGQRVMMLLASGNGESAIGVVNGIRPCAPGKRLQGEAQGFFDVLGCGVARGGVGASLRHTVLMLTAGSYSLFAHA